MLVVLKYILKLMVKRREFNATNKKNADKGNKPKRSKCEYKKLQLTLR